MYTRIVQKQVRKGDLCYMNSNMEIPELKGVMIDKIEQVEERIVLLLEGINNTSKVFKRNAYGFRKYGHFKAKVLLSRVYKNIGVHIG